MTARSTWAALLAITLLAGCGAPSTPTPSTPATTLAPTLPARAWQAQVVLAPDRVAFEAGAHTTGVLTGAQTAWVEDGRAGWIPAEDVDDTNRLGLVEWHGKLVSWSDGGVIRTSDDGTLWSDAIVQPDEGNPSALAPFGDQLVLLGEGTRKRVGAWRSADGAIWAGVEGSPVGMKAGASVSSGSLVAVGWTGASAAAWNTSDALTWTPLPFPVQAGASTSALAGVAAGGGRIVTIGDVDGAAAAWSSSDLDRWTRSGPFLGDDTLLASVAYGRGIFVVAGKRDDRPVIWESADGLTWTAVPLPLAASTSGAVSDVLIQGSRIVAFGSTTEDAGNGGSFRSGYLVWTLDTGG